MVSIILVLSALLSSVAFAENRLLQGVILDESGKPVSGAELFLYDSIKIKRPADFISPKTGSDGKFVFNVPSGKYWGVARVRHGDKFGPLLSGDLHSGEPLEMDLAESRQDFTFTVADIRDLARAKEKVRSDMAVLSGKVLDQSGKPVSSAAVFVWRDPVTERLPDMVSAWTEAGGDYSLLLLPGVYSVTADAVFPPAVAGRRIVPVTVIEGKKVVALNLQVTRVEKDSMNGSAGVTSDELPLDDE
jgi:hypothetical protein